MTVGVAGSRLDSGRIIYFYYAKKGSSLRHNSRSSKRWRLSRPFPDELDGWLVGRARDRRQRERPIGIEFVGTRERLADVILEARKLDLVGDNLLFGVDAERAGVENGCVCGIEARGLPSRRPAETVAYLQRAWLRYTPADADTRTK